MIGSLLGKITDIDSRQVILEVGGVGYLVTVVDQTKFILGKEVKVFTHTHVREDELTLFGFPDKKSLKIFRLLISVSGVGPKMAMNILAKGSAATIQTAVATADVAFFTSVSGIGKKNGQRIIVDLKSKMGSVADLDLSEPEPGVDEVFDGLVAMGFEPARVKKVLDTLDPSTAESQRIKQAIKLLSQG